MIDREGVEQAAQLLDRYLNDQREGTDPKVCFALVVCPFPDMTDRPQFITNGDPRHTIPFVKHLMGYLEQSGDVGRAKPIARKKRAIRH